MPFGGTRGPALRVCTAIMPWCYVIRLCRVSTLFNIQRFRAKCTTDLHHTKKLHTSRKKCRVFRYPTQIFTRFCIPSPWFLHLFAYHVLIVAHFCIPQPDFYTVLHTETRFFTSFCIPSLNFCTILHTPRIFRKNCIDLMQKFTDFCAKISKI